MLLMHIDFIEVSTSKIPVARQGFFYLNLPSQRITFFKR